MFFIPADFLGSAKFNGPTGRLQSLRKSEESHSAGRSNVGSKRRSNTGSKRKSNAGQTQVKRRLQTWVKRSEKTLLQPFILSGWGLPNIESEKNLPRRSPIRLSRRLPIRQFLATARYCSRAGSRRGRGALQTQAII